MYKNKLQDLSQRSCFNLPSYTCIREGPDHSPRFKATVNFNGELFESPGFCSTLRQAEHSAAEVALDSLSSRGSSHSLAARILDETGVYKNLLQEISQRVGALLPQYATYRTGLGHLPVFTGTVELAGIIFTGEPAKNKKQAKKNAAMAAWSSLKQLAKEDPSTETKSLDEQEQVTVARTLLKYRLKERIDMASSPNSRPKKFSFQNSRPHSSQSSSASTSKILPLICSNITGPQQKCNMVTSTNSYHLLSKPVTSSPALRSQSPILESHSSHSQKFPSAGAAPYIPIQQFVMPYHHIAPSVAVRTAVPCFSSPCMSPPGNFPSPVMHAPAPVHFSVPIAFRQTVHVFGSSVKSKEPAPRPRLVLSPALSPLSRAVVSKTVSSRQEHEGIICSLENLKLVRSAGEHGGSSVK
uniref:DRBM domain-containing protein n=1 Tax=Kalanchoe fedtschenkoi TaxID=63787 RepID=A0A7N0ZXZ1_KALFE